MENNKDELFTRLYDRYYEGIYSYIFANVKDKWDTEDIVSVVFTKLYINREKIVYIEYSKSWIYRIAHNSIIDYYRSNKKVIPMNCILERSILERSVFEDGYENILIKEEFDEVFKIIEDFPTGTKKILELRFFEGLKFREISEATNISENTIKTTINRAVKRVKKIYENNLLDKKLHI